MFKAVKNVTPLTNPSKVKNVIVHKMFLQQNTNVCEGSVACLLDAAYNKVW